MTICRAESRPCLGYYYLDRKIGSGNYAIVRLAEHRITGTKVAMKIIDKNKLNKEDLPRLFREVQIMKLMNHPNVIKLIQVIETSQYIHLVTQYAAQGELFEYIRKAGRLPEPRAKLIFTQICNAVKYCHSESVVHRDLKIENLLLDSKDNIKIADFGFSNYYQENKHLLTTFCGSPQYAAPEIFAGKDYNGFKVDIWSLGVVLYVLVTGGLPFDGNTTNEVKRSVLCGKFRVPFYVSHECEALLRAILTVEPEKRPSFEDIMSHPWMDTPTPPTTAPAPVKKPSLDETVLKVMQTMGVATSEVVKSYNSYLFNDYTAIYKLLKDQLTDVGEMDIARVTKFLQESRQGQHKAKPEPESEPSPPPSPTNTTHETSSTPHTTSQTLRTSNPAPPISRRSIPVKTLPSRRGLENVFYQAKSRAISAIFHRHPSPEELKQVRHISDDSSPQRNNLKMNQFVANSSTIVSSLISPKPLNFSAADQAPSNSMINNLMN